MFPDLFAVNPYPFHYKGHSLLPHPYLPRHPPCLSRLPGSLGLLLMSRVPGFAIKRTRQAYHVPLIPQTDLGLLCTPGDSTGV
jgi:hypothetical protein